MLGKHVYQPELFVTLNIEALIPKNHLLNRIDGVLDLTFLRRIAAPLYSSDQGRPSIDPEMFVRMILLQYLYNVSSDRRLCEEIGYNLAYRWFCRMSLKDKVPDHSSLTRIRDRLGEKTYQKIFLKIVAQCRKAGLVKGEKLMADGSLIQANASLYAMVERDQKKTAAREKSKKKDFPDQKDSPTSTTTKAGLGPAPSKDGLSNRDLRKNSIAGRKISNETHISRTDPEATLCGKHGEYKSLRYKTHHIIDGGSRVILDCHVTTGIVSEVKAFPERFMTVNKALKLSVEEMIADRGYGSGENLEQLQKQGVRTNIPLWNTRIGTGFGKEEGFSFDDQAKTVTCPEGHRMERKPDEPANLRFVLSKKICSNCPRFETCISAAGHRNNRGKQIRIAFHQRLYEQVLEQEKTPEFRKKLRERMWKMEGVFAEGKSHHGLRRARYRGRWKVQAQIYMISTVQNLKRLAAKAVLAPATVLCELIRSLFERQNSRMPPIFYLGNLKIA